MPEPGPIEQALREHERKKQYGPTIYKVGLRSGASYYFDLEIGPIDAWALFTVAEGHGFSGPPALVTTSGRGVISAREAIEYIEHCWNVNDERTTT